MALVAVTAAVSVPLAIHLASDDAAPAASSAAPAPAPAGRLAGALAATATDTPSPKAPLLAGASLDLQVTGVGGVPAQGVEAVVVTVTAVDATAETFLTVWPTGEARPLASALNPGPGRTVANTVVARVSAEGRVSIFNRSGAVHVVVDVLGWLATGAGMHTQTPIRLFDSRTTVIVAAGATVPVAVAGHAGVPADARAVVANLTATDATAASYVTAWPAGTARPFASNLNPAPGRTVANLVVVALGADGSISLFNNAGSVHLVLDVLGWLGPDGGYVGSAPTRLFDSRTRPAGPLTADAAVAVAVVEALTSGPAPGPTTTTSIGAPTTTSVAPTTVAPTTTTVGPTTVAPSRPTTLPPVPVPVPASADATAAIVNVTATGASGDTYLVTWPTGGERPATSSLNPSVGPAQANTVIVGLGTGRSVSVYNHAGKVDIVVDLLGSLTASSGIHPLAPARLLDTRPADVHHAFPVALTVTPRPSYVHDHHDYPATDIFADCGAPVLSPVDGVVVHVRRTDSYVPSVGNPATLGGRSIAILGDDGVRYYGSHLESFVDGVAVGLRVTAGQPVAVLGRTGDAGACHVHFGLSPPCSGVEWQVRRGVIWPGDYLDSWRAGGNLGPATEIAAWSAAHPTACADAQALPTAPQSEDPPG